MSFLKNRKSKNSNNAIPIEKGSDDNTTTNNNNSNTTPSSSERMVLVTVGTTRFDALIKAIDTKQLADALAIRGYTKIVVQAGKSDHTPTNIITNKNNTTTTNTNSNKQNPLYSCHLENGLSVEWYEYVPSLAPLLQQCTLVISHAGSGSLFEALNCASTTVIAVPNNTLMDNHQVELADKLAGEGYLFTATPETLLSVVKEMDESKLVGYSPGDGRGIVDVVNSVCGVVE